MNWVLITPHQGLGDHILCLGIYREYSAIFNRVFISVRSDYVRELKVMLSDLPNITILKLPINHLWRNTRNLQMVARLLRIRVLGLGGYGENFLMSESRFDVDFYRQANVDFEKRRSSSFIPRNIKKENELFDLLGCDLQPYIFLHEDVNRNFTIRREFLPKGTKIIEPSADRKIYNLVDYRKVIEFAQEIHTIESSFAAYIEGLSLNTPLYAHRYARPEANQDSRLEFSYWNPWKILNI